MAVVERGKHVLAFKMFTDSLPVQSVADWLDMVQAWEGSPATAPNPYEFRRSRTVSHNLLGPRADTRADVTGAALRVELAEEDALAIREGRATTLHEYYSSSTLIVVGIEIEDQQ